MAKTPIHVEALTHRDASAAYSDHRGAIASGSRGRDVQADALPARDGLIRPQQPILTKSL